MVTKGAGKLLTWELNCRWVEKKRRQEDDGTREENVGSNKTKTHRILKKVLDTERTKKEKKHKKSMILKREHDVL